MSDAAEPAGPSAGTVIGERYRLVERIGSGGMGLVYRAEHTLMGKALAVKLLHAELGRDPDAVRRFEREAQSASRLTHEGIVQVTDFGRATSGELFLVMELVRGVSLGKALSDEGRFSVTRTLGIMRQILAALEHAHGAGVVHRDLKPDNVLLAAPDATQSAVDERTDRVKLLDFGIAKMHVGARGGEALTQAGLIVGTPAYMAPEQAMGEPTDARADLYSCGVVLFELLAGRRPFIGDSAVQVISQHLSAPPPAPGSVITDGSIPPSVDRLVLHALEKEPGKRFQNATDFLRAIDAALVDSAARGRTTGLVEVRGQGGERPLSRITVTLDIDEARRAVARNASRLWVLSRWVGARAIGISGEIVRQGREVLRRVLALPAPRRRLVISGALVGVVLAVAIGGFLRGRNPSRPRALSTDEAKALRPIERAIDDEQWDRARSLIEQELARTPDLARLHLLRGTVELRDGASADGWKALAQAIDLDAGYRRDPTLLRRAAAVLKDKKSGPLAVAFLREQIGSPACAPLAEAASSSRLNVVRRDARDATDKLGCVGVDRAASFGLDLRQTKDCGARRKAIASLRDLGGPRALEQLRKARKGGGGSGSGLASLFEDNDDEDERPKPECGGRELDEAVEALAGR